MQTGTKSDFGNSGGLFAGLGAALQDAVLITLVAGGIGMLANLVHPEGIPFVAEKNYETLVPCPVAGGEVTPLAPDDAALRSGDTFLIDARSAEEYKAWRYRQAMNVPYDYLDPTPAETIGEMARRVASSGARRVVVIGDGQQPDSGKWLGKEISGKGIKNVFFVKGGAKALKAASGSGGGS
ncbi:MAG TPA: rhodanese-like domain-containing protein [Myxococcota bacterium]|nr:rhodanese-like domain-containing protein [Myxococcota bacterium]